MSAPLPPLDWHTFLTTWSLRPGWTLVCVAALAAYVVGLRRAARRGRRPVHPVRVVSFAGGMVVLVVCLSSAVDGYAMSLFWMHMIEHLTLITVVPALVVLGHPLTVARAAGGERWQRGFDAVMTRGPVAVLTNPAVGLVVYAVVIFYTHLTPFMDSMVAHPWLMTVEQLAYLGSGWLMLVSVVGEEPLRWRTSYLLRLVFLVMAMVPDTLVGIVLLQTTHEPFPTYMAMRPDWTPDGLRDLEIGGSLMWAAGDGLMMLLSVGVVVSLVSGRTRDRLIGPWLESARTATFVHHTGHGELDPDGDLDDSDDALEAYNRMLRRMGEAAPPT